MTDGDDTRLRVTLGRERRHAARLLRHGGDRRRPGARPAGGPLDQVAPGVYEAPTRARSRPAPTRCACSRSAPAWPISGGRWCSSRRPRPSTGCWASTSRSSRRCAPRPAGAPSTTAAEVWTHDLRTTAFATDLWPLLLVLALLLWPIDVAIRRVSISRRELVAGSGVVRLRGCSGAVGRPGPRRSAGCWPPRSARRVRDRVPRSSGQRGCARASHRRSRRRRRQHRSSHRARACSTLSRRCPISRAADPVASRPPSRAADRHPGAPARGQEASAR